MVDVPMCPPRLARLLLRRPRRFRTNKLELEHPPEMYEEARRIFSDRYAEFDAMPDWYRFSVKNRRR